MIIIPRNGEKQRKIMLLRQGENVRAPKRWWDKMFRKTRRQYPTYPEKRIDRIIGGIWDDHSTATKVKIVKEYQ